MTYCEIREINNPGGAALAPNVAIGEPRHIHIPRPSRVARANEAARRPTQREAPVVQEAA